MTAKTELLQRLDIDEETLAIELEDAGIDSDREEIPQAIALEIANKYRKTPRQSAQLSAATAQPLEHTGEHIDVSSQLENLFGQALSANAGVYRDATAKSIAAAMQYGAIEGIQSGFKQIAIATPNPSSVSEINEAIVTAAQVIEDVARNVRHVASFDPSKA